MCEFVFDADAVAYLAWIKHKVESVGESLLAEVTLRRGGDKSLISLVASLHSSPILAKGLQQLNIVDIQTEAYPPICVQKFPNLRRFTLIGSDRRFLAHHTLASLGKLTQLELKHRFVGKLKLWLRHLPFLQELRLELQTHPNHGPSVAVLPGIEFCAPTLRKLHVAFQGGFPSRAVADASSCTNLVSLRLRLRRGRDETPCMEDHFKNLSRLQKLQTLLLLGGQIGYDHLRHAASLSGLTSLALRHNDFLGANCVKFATTTFTNLESLDLSASRRFAANHADVESLIPLPPKIKSLNILGTGISVSIVQGLVPATVAVAQIRLPKKPNYGGTFVVQYPVLPAAEANAIFLRRRRARLRLQRCAFCGEWERETAQFPRCGKCKKVFYCDARCQNAHWVRQHRQECGIPVAAVRPVSEPLPT